ISWNKTKETNVVFYYMYNFSGRGKESTFELRSNMRSTQRNEIFQSRNVIVYLSSNQNEYNFLYPDKDLSFGHIKDDEYNCYALKSFSSTFWNKMVASTQGIKYNKDTYYIHFVHIMLSSI